MHTLLEFFAYLYLGGFSSASGWHFTLSILAWAHSLVCLLLALGCISDYADYAEDHAKLTLSARLRRRQQSARQALGAFLAMLVPFGLVVGGLAWLLWQLPHTVSPVRRFLRIAWSLPPQVPAAKVTKEGGCE